MTEAQGSSGAGGRKEKANPLPSDILEKLRIRELEPLQWVGLWLALAFFSYIILASGTIFFVSFRYIQLPPFPAPPATQPSIRLSSTLTSSLLTFTSRWRRSRSNVRHSSSNWWWLPRYCRCSAPSLDTFLARRNPASRLDGVSAAL